MAKSATMKSVKTPVLPTENIHAGIWLSLLSIPAGIILWLILWKMGFIASIVSFAIAWIAIFLYAVGAKAPASKRSAPLLISVIVIGVILAFLSGMASDALDIYTQEIKVDTINALTDSNFWSFYAENILSNGELWSSYTTDILMTVAFAVLGCFSLVKGLFVPKEPTASEVKKAK